ncbi:unnamed protein product [Ceutorhynchus assimilis]|uniref:Persulfide dioxygenase ETHE1, mitochondrial n=1 Tax=Ceutorhynchus assimilis TaxID=467358 RepID=A0A9N9MLU7_9CUCU|nr:unnamed protein product [Ceutorhynchus assimilis]
MNKVSGLGAVMRKFSQQGQGEAADGLIFRQLFDHISSTYTYLLGCASSKDCILIDPVLEQVKRDFQLVQDLGLNLKYAVNTHMHADHVTGTGHLRLLSGCRTIISKASGADADIHVEENDSIEFGNQKLQVLSTPGHTNGCVTYYNPEQAMAFTGDALLIRGCGRTDFQEGDPRTLYRNVHDKILSLPKYTRLFPAHDYKGQTCTTVDEEKRLNPRLTKTEDQFVEIMNNLNLAYPKQIDRALPANKACGVYDIPEDTQKHTI